eukprot:IDg15718t1
MSVFYHLIFVYLYVKPSENGNSSIAQCAVRDDVDRGSLALLCDLTQKWNCVRPLLRSRYHRVHAAVHNLVRSDWLDLPVRCQHRVEPSLCTARRGITLRRELVSRSLEGYFHALQRKRLPISSFSRLVYAFELQKQDSGAFFVMIGVAW